jgi:hypothetical protein
MEPGDGLFRLVERLRRMLTGTGRLCESQIFEGVISEGI